MVGESVLGRYATAEFEERIAAIEENVYWPSNIDSDSDWCREYKGSTLRRSSRNGLPRLKSGYRPSRTDR